LFGTNNFAIGSKADSLFCEYVQTFGPNISNIIHPRAEALAGCFVCGHECPLHTHDWHVQPFVKDRFAFPPERRVFSPPGSPCGESVRPRNLSTLSRTESAVNLLEAQDFHLFSTAQGVSKAGLREAIHG
jgi:hypothetical protein